jgi:2-polyprenyl-6-methoxyphenol hydroxylase-like FAD-dependent oxidoreductase
MDHPKEIAMNPQTNCRPKLLAGRHAIVIGGSMSGLLAARVLADYVDRVTVIDRDTFPTLPAHRSGVPQSHHAHALLGRGQMILTQLFPSLLDDLRADGALAVRNAVPIVIVSPAGMLPSQRMPGEFMAFSRLLLEWHVRRHIQARAEVRFLENSEVTGLLATADRSQVVGVHVRRRGAEGAPEELRADLVVDASGRFSKAPAWLEALGYAAPPEETITSGLGYASRFYQKPDNFPDEWQGIIINGRPPHNPRAGLILPIENGGWHVTMGGFANNPPPTSEDGFLQWARDLADPSIYEAIRVARPLSPIRGYRTPENRLRHFERMPRRPRGFIVTGDAVCAFNPIYGQGMTVSAMDALVLDACLKQERGSFSPDFEQRFQVALAQTVADPWLVSTGEDLRWPGIQLTGARSQLGTGLLHRYMDLVLRQATEDPVVTGAYLVVISMFAPPQSLVHPRLLLRVLGGALRRATRRSINAESPARFALSPEAIAHLRAQTEADYAYS